MLDFIQKNPVSCILVGLGILCLIQTYGAIIVSRKGRFVSGIPCVGGLFILLGFLISDKKLLCLLCLLDYGILYLPYQLICYAVWIVLQKRRFGKAAKKLGLKEIKGGDQSKRLRVTSEIGTYDMYYLTGNCHYYNNFEICFDGDGRRVVLAMTGGDNAEVLPFDGDKLTIESLRVTLEIVPFEQ